MIYSQLADYLHPKHRLVPSAAPMNLTVYFVSLVCSLQSRVCVRGSSAPTCCALRLLYDRIVVRISRSRTLAPYGQKYWKAAFLLKAFLTRGCHDSFFSSSSCVGYS